MRVKPDGPADAPLAIIGEAPGDEEVAHGLSLVGPTGRKLWGMASDVGLPARQIGEDGIAFGAALRWIGEDNGECVGIDAWVGNVSQEPITEKLDDHKVMRYAKRWAPELQAVLPKSKVYLLLGDLACRTVMTANLPTTKHHNWKSVMEHCSSIVPAREARGLISLPDDAHCIAIRHPAALLHGEDQWFPSVKLGLQRAACLLGLNPAGAIPKPPPRIFNLFATSTHFDEVLAAVAQSGKFAVDLETPFDARNIIIGSFAVGERVWVFGKQDTIALMSKLAATSAKVIGHNEATFDLPVLARNGVAWPSGKVHDTLWVDAKLRPRMPHHLAHVASHCLDWGPPNWKPIAYGEHPMSALGREYCAIDSRMAWYIAEAQDEALKERGLEGRAAILERMLPVIGRCAIEGVNVDEPMRTELRESIHEALGELLEEFNGDVREWVGVKVNKLSALLNLYKKRYLRWKEMALSKRGLEERAVRGVFLAEAIDERNCNKKEVDSLRKRIKQLSNFRPTQTDVLREFLFDDPDGLRIKASGVKTKTGKVKIGKDELAALAQRGDVVERIEKGDSRLLILHRISDAERLRSALANHLGARMEKGKVDLSKDTQLHDGRLSVIYNPVQMRFSAGKSKGVDAELSDPLAMQLHNVSSETSAVVGGVRRVWNLRRQFIPDDPLNQVIIVADWKRMEQYVMAWQAGSRIGYWRWLEDLYNGVDTHSAMAAIVLDGCPSDTKGAKAFRLPIGGVERSGYWIGKQANHALTLGATEHMLKTKYNIPVKIGKAILKRFRESERGQAIAALHKHIEQEAIDTQRVKTPFKGEEVDFWAVNVRKGGMRMRDPRKAYAVAQQGTAACIMQTVLADFDAVMRDNGGRKLLQVHDEFVGCVGRDRVERAKVGVEEVMTREWIEMPVPFDGGRGLRIPVEIGTGGNWGDAR